MGRVVLLDKCIEFLDTYHIYTRKFVVFEGSEQPKLGSNLDENTMLEIRSQAEPYTRKTPSKTPGTVSYVLRDIS